MTALYAITLEQPQRIYDELNQIINAAEKGSVITKDQAVGILIKLSTLDEYAENSFILLMEQLMKSPTNQLPMYAENALSVVNSGNKSLLINVLQLRLVEIEKESKRKRVEKMIKKLTLL